MITSLFYFNLVLQFSLFYIYFNDGFWLYFLYFIAILIFFSQFSVSDYFNPIFLRIVYYFKAIFQH